MIDLTNLIDTRISGIFYDKEVNRIILTFEDIDERDEFYQDYYDETWEVFEHNIAIQL